MLGWTGALGSGPKGLKGSRRFDDDVAVTEMWFAIL